MCEMDVGLPPDGCRINNIRSSKWLLDLLTATQKM
jgi:hypothetical protein